MIGNKRVAPLRWPSMPCFSSLISGSFPNSMRPTTGLRRPGSVLGLLVALRLVPVAAAPAAQRRPRRGALAALTAADLRAVRRGEGPVYTAGERPGGRCADPGGAQSPERRGAGRVPDCGGGGRGRVF